MSANQIDFSYRNLRESFLKNQLSVLNKSREITFPLNVAIRQKNISHYGVVLLLSNYEVENFQFYTL